MSHNTSYCLTEVVTKASFNVHMTKDCIGNYILVQS